MGKSITTSAIDFHRQMEEDIEIWRNGTLMDIGLWIVDIYEFATIYAVFHNDSCTL